MKNNPNKATIEEMTGLYHNLILPLLVETDQFLKSQQKSKVGCVASFHAPLTNISGSRLLRGEAANPAHQVGLEW